MTRLSRTAPPFEAALDRTAARLPLDGALGELLDQPHETLSFDPRASGDALIIGSAVLRSATGRVSASAVQSRGTHALFEINDWCHAVEGAPAGLVLSNGSLLDARRLALRYGLLDAVLVGSATVAEEGLAAPGDGGWTWALDTPLRFPVLAPDARSLSTAFAAARARLHAEGWRSSRTRPALIVITRGATETLPAWLRAPALQAPDSWILTSRDGARRLLERCRAAGSKAPIACDRLAQMLLPHSTAQAPSRIDIATVPRMLRERLKVRMAAHDGGRRTLGAFAKMGALHQLDLTFIGAPPLAATHPNAQPKRFDQGRGFDGLTPLRVFEHEEGSWLAQCRVDGKRWA
ncbi:MAG: hypothetical protein VX766_17165 [Pseudomonadota bacterium]|nr:hypothetical protein [Pseudomonadota bacterium]